MQFEEVKKDRKQHHIFATNFGYEGRELDLAMSMFGLGFENGFDDLKKTLDHQQAKIDKLVEALGSLIFHCDDFNTQAESFALAMELEKARQALREIKE